jgi:GalNAc5-diNAcBac-PP-undecaprenol beta-1,3-glucosyltransferase
MTIRATVLIPTHDHGPTLRYAAESALAQTFSDLEVLIVGDGATDETRETALSLEKDDDRVRFFDNPKGPRHGEVHRHAALQDARGDIVCYLSDDDLWLPNHVELLAGALQAADFAHTMTGWVHPDGTIGSFFGNIADPRQRARLLSDKWNFVPLSAAAHTLASYRRLPEGWHTTPADLWTDLRMWRRFLADPACVAVSIPIPTVIHFASAEREDWSLAARLEELAQAAADLTEPARRGALTERIHEAAIERAHAELIRIGDRMDGFEARKSALEEQVRWLEGALEEVRSERDGARAERDAVRKQVRRMERSKTWRLRARLLRNPILAAWHRRRAAKARSRPRP